MPPLYIALEHVLADVSSGLNYVAKEVAAAYAGREELIPGIDVKMDPIPGAVEAFQRLASRYDVFIVSVAPWENATAWTGKLQWVSEHFGVSARDRLILAGSYRLLAPGTLVATKRHEFAGKFFEVLPGGPDWDAIEQSLKAVEP